MKVSELGEFGLVELIAKTVVLSRDDKAPSWQRLLTGIGDDCAAWRGDNSIQLAKVDALVENVHFTLDTASWADLGWKALAINLSDIAAMGGIPEYALVSLALRPSIEVEDVLSLYRGMLELAKKYGVAIIGGDTDSTPHISVTVTVLGNMGERQNYLTRSSAKAGDLIAVTGYPGTAAAGFRILSEKLTVSLVAAQTLRKAFLRPNPRIAEGQLLLDSGIRTAIDISDGLVADLGHVCKASGVGATLEAGLVPVLPEVENIFGESAREIALTGGEDYELLFTGNSEAIKRVKSESACPVTVIGKITGDHPGEVKAFGTGGKPVNLKKGGWEHFISNPRPRL